MYATISLRHKINDAQKRRIHMHLQALYIILTCFRLFRVRSMSFLRDSSLCRNDCPKILEPNHYSGTHTHMICRTSVLYHRIRMWPRLRLRRHLQCSLAVAAAQARRLTVANPPRALQLGHRGGRLFRGRRHVRPTAEQRVVRIGRTPVWICGCILRRRISGRCVIVKRCAASAGTAKRGAGSAGSAAADNSRNSV